MYLVSLKYCLKSSFQVLSTEFIVLQFNVFDIEVAQ